jgi:hypothetical protein
LFTDPETILESAATSLLRFSCLTLARGVNYGRGDHYKPEWEDEAERQRTVQRRADLFLQGFIED